MLGSGDPNIVVPFLLVLAFALLGLMALPGWVLMRTGTRHAA